VLDPLAEEGVGEATTNSSSSAEVRALLLRVDKATRREGAINDINVVSRESAGLQFAIPSELLLNSQDFMFHIIVGQVIQLQFCS
jgi:hypothetical protein